MEAVEHQAQRRAVHLLHPLPGLLPAVHMGSPGQRLIADYDPLLFRQRGQRPQVRHLQFAIRRAVRLHIAAQQQRVAAQLAHQRKFASGAGHIGRKLRPAGAFKIAKGLKKRDF